MADTEDVARVLYQWITGDEYRADGYLDDLRPEELLARLQNLSFRYSIGIEDAKQLLAKREERDG